MWMREVDYTGGQEEEEMVHESCDRARAQSRWISRWDEKEQMHSIGKRGCQKSDDSQRDYAGMEEQSLTRNDLRVQVDVKT